MNTSSHSLSTPTIPLSAIVTGLNPRRYFDPAEMAELEGSIRAVGVLQPVVIRDLGEGAFGLIAGERRYRAARNVFGEDAHIPVHIVAADDDKAAEMAMVENVARANMSPAEEAEAAAKLLGQFNGDRDEVARRLGMSRATLDRRLALMNASDKVRDALIHRKIDLGHAELLAALTRVKQDETLQRLLALEKLPSIEDCKRMLQAAAKTLATAIFPKEDCGACQHNSDMQGAMFADAVSSGHCTNGACFDQKTEAALQAIYDSLEGEFPHRKIVRPGENFTVIKLMVDGAKGVGAEQAESCRACKSYGAAVMGTPDALGKVARDACFDPGCNAKMVAKRIKEEAKKAAASAPAAGAAASSKSKAAATSATTATTSVPAKKTAVTEVKVTGQVEEYRKKLWRDALRAEIRLDMKLCSRVLIAAATCGQGRNISGAKMVEAMKRIAGIDSLGKNGVDVSGGQIAAVLTCMDGLEQPQLKELAQEVTCQTVEDMNDAMVVAVLRHFKADLSKHYRLDKDLLDRLTKSEIEVLAKDIGLDKAMGVEAFKKLVAKKKDEIVKETLAVKDFDYSAVPGFLSLDAKIN